MAQFRKSKSLFGGLVRLTATKKGMSVSTGVKGARVSFGADGKVRRTFSAPGTGLRDTKVIGTHDAKLTWKQDDPAVRMATERQIAYLGRLMEKHGATAIEIDDGSQLSARDFASYPASVVSSVITQLEGK